MYFIKPSLSYLVTRLCLNMASQTPTQESKPAVGPWQGTPPPFPTIPYSPTKALEDIDGIVYALHLFLGSHMVESEQYCREYDPKMCVHPQFGPRQLLTIDRERLYFATGFGLIQCVKGMMSFEDEVRMSRITLP